MELIQHAFLLPLSSLPASNYRENSKEYISVVYLGLCFAYLFLSYFKIVLYLLYVDFVFYSTNTLTHSWYVPFEFEEHS